MTAHTAHERKVGIDFAGDLGLGDRHRDADHRNPFIHRLDVFLSHAAFRDSADNNRVCMAGEAVIEL